MEINQDNIDKIFPFKEYRPYQKESIRYITENYLNQNKKFFVLESPTGTGKSGIGYTVGKYVTSNEKISIGPKIIVCTKTKQLQEQYVESFSDIKKIESAKNHECEMYPDMEEAYYGSPLCGKTKCPEYRNCSYIKCKKLFKQSVIGVTNYHYFLHSREFKPKFLILDEAHSIEEILCDVSTFKIFPRTIKWLLKSTVSKKVQENIIQKIVEVSDLQDDVFLDALTNLRFYLNQMCDKVNDTIETLREIKPLDDKNRRELGKLCQRSIQGKNIVEKIDLFMESDKNWIVIDEGDGVKLKPLSLSNQSYELFKKSNKILLMSATICGIQQFCNDINIELDQYGGTSIPSIINKNQRKVYNLKIGYLNKKNKLTLWPIFMENIDKIIDYVGSVRGIIHSVSFENAELILKYSKHKERMMISRNINVINSLKKRVDQIIVGPNILEGVDLIGDLSRFQIFPKVPYGNLGDIWVKTKMEQDLKWYNRNTIIKIIQGSGRSIRSEDDWATTFILDSNFDRLLMKNRELFSQWFLDSIV